MLKRITAVISISLFFFGCAPRTSMVYTDNLACTESIVNGALEIAWEDYSLPASLKKTFFNEISKSYINYFHNKEFNTFHMAFNPKFKDAKERKYLYYIQNNDDGCWAKLYKREVSAGTWNVNLSSGSILTLDSYKLNLCNCSGNKMEVGF